MRYERSLSIDKIIETGIPISVLHREVGKKEVKAALDVLLVRLVKSLNLKWNIEDDQVKYIVQDLIDKYPNETIEDFMLVFRRARMGGFKDEKGNSAIYRLDGSVIFGWMDIYLSEKYEALERKLEAEKDDYYKVPKKDEVKSERHQYWLDKLKEAVAPVDGKKVPPLSDHDVLREGQQKAVSKTRPSTTMQDLIRMELHTQYIRENYDKYTGEKNKDWIAESEWLKKQNITE